jgi:mannose-1-phosphate guanylyltransferase / mannose-6-phosphate isomerase
MSDMANLDQYTIASSATLLDAVEKIQRNRSRCVFALQQNKVVGVLSEGDVMRALLKGISVYTVLGELINPSFAYLTERDIHRAFEMVKKHHFAVIPVVDDDFHLYDVITLSDVLAHVEVNDPSAS